MSAGFVEPLEASALVLIELSAKMIAEQLPANREVMAITAKRFNEKFLYRWNQIIDFLKLHYVLNQRNDSDYWKQHRHLESVPASLNESLKLWQYQAPWHQDAPHIDEMFSSASFQYVLYGMGFVTEQNHIPLKAARQQRAKANKLFSDNLHKTAQLLDALPTNRQLTDKVREYGFQKI